MTTTQLEILERFHDEQRRAGARVEDRHGRPVPLAFGPVDEEHAALGSAAGLCDDTDRCLVRVQGQRAAEMVDGLLTNRVKELPPEAAVYAFMLTSKGRPVADLRALRMDRDIVWLDLPAAAREGALDHLGRYLPPRLASHEPMTDRVRLAVVGPRSRAAVESALGGGLPELGPLEATEAGEGSLLAVRREPVEGPGLDLYLPVEELRERWEALAAACGRQQGRPVGRTAYDIWRVERGVPAYGAEITREVLPQETGQGERALDLDKGCYTGQEVVARIHYRGKVNRWLAGLRLPEGLDELPGTGAELYADGRARGRVTSAVRSPRRGPVALGYVRRELEPGDRLALRPDGEARVEVTELPFVEIPGDAEASPGG